MKNSLVTIILLLICLSGFGSTPFKCTLKGVVINRNSKTLLLIKASDAQTANRQPIAIKDGKFNFSFEVKETEAYALIFEDEINAGSWTSITFFPVKGEVIFKLYPEGMSDKNEIKGGQLNKDYTDYQNLQSAAFSLKTNEINEKQSLLESKKDYYSPERDSLFKIIYSKNHEDVDRSVYLKLIQVRSSGNEFTADGKLLKKEHDILTADENAFRYQYIKTHITPVSFYLMFNDVYDMKDDQALVDAIQKSFPVFAAKYPNHPYTKLISNEINAFFNVKVGRPFTDVSAPDLTGKVHRVSNLAKDKITLIDFWGSWCGPCIAATRTMVPVYNEFKEKGFNIVGIAREFQTSKDLAIALKREKYPWTNLIELNDKNHIWNKYGISNESGLMLLLDKEQKIIAINPTADEVRKVVQGN